MFLSNKLNIGAGTPPPTIDPQFNYVTMLLHGDGTNGAQNNTFLDGSANTFTITRYGNTTQGSFSPYGSNWSNYFGGVSRIYTPHNSNFLFGTGDFTMECWINMASGTPLLSYWASFLSVGADATSDGNGVTLYVTDGNSGSSVAGEVAANIGTTRFYSGQDIRGLGWVHVALTRQGSTNRLFLNGVLKSTITNSLNIDATNYGASIALSKVSQSNYFEGYVSNARVVKGNAVYTSNFTPSTTPLTVISGTSLLTCANNRFIDKANNFVIEVIGTPSVQRFNPFGTSTAYSTSVIGGSGYFDGSGDDLTTGITNGVGSGDFTIEYWLYPNALYDYITVFGTFRSSTGVSVGTQSAGQLVLYVAGSGEVLRGTTAMKINTWNHCAFTRQGSTMRGYLNGVLDATGSLSNNLSQTSAAIGSLDHSSEYTTGYISDLRVVSGTALYTGSTLTVPTAPLTAVTNTKLLMNFTNGAIYDNAMMNDLETAGAAQISTIVKKYGTGSLAFDGTGDYLIPPSGQNVTFRTGNFTIEGWFYWNSLVSESAIMWGNGVGWTFYIYPANKLQWGTTTPLTSANLLTGSSTLATGQWYHIAVTRSSNTLTLWVNGVSDGTVTDSNNYSSNGKLALGISHSNEYFNGYMDDVRITKGYARYTATFTPPTAAFPNIGPT